MALVLSGYATPRFDYDAEFGTGVASQWNDQSGNAYHCTQATGANQPVLTANVAAFGTRPAYRFNNTGANKWWDIPAGAFTGLTECMVFVALISDGDPISPYGGFLKTGSSGLSQHTPFSDGLIYDDFCSTTRKGGFGQVSTPARRSLATAARVIAIRSKASDYAFIEDGQTVYGTATNTFGVGAVLQIGNGTNTSGGAQQFLGYIARVFGVATVPSVATQKAIIEAMLGYYKASGAAYPYPDTYKYPADLSSPDSRIWVPSDSRIYNQRSPADNALLRGSLPDRRTLVRGGQVSSALFPPPSDGNINYRNPVDIFRYTTSLRSAGEGGSIATVTGDTTPPSFAGATSAVANSASQVTVSWAQATDDQTTQANIWYEVHVDTAAGTTFNPTRVVKGVGSIAVTGLLPSTTYYFRVRARDAGGNYSSAPSQAVEVSATTASTAPTTPGNFTAIAWNTSQILVDWDPSTDDVSGAAALKYEVHWSTSPMATFDARKVVQGPTTTYTILCADSGPGTYYVRVRARDEAGNYSAETAEISVALTDTANVDIAGGTLTSAVALDPRAIRVNFTEPGPAWGGNFTILFHVATSAAAAFDRANIHYVAAPDGGLGTGDPRFVDVSGLLPNTHYYVRIYVEDRWGVLHRGVTEVAVTTPDELAANKPTIANISPTAGTAITPTTAISFDVTDTGSIRRTIVTVTQADTGIKEVVHDGNAFAAPFSTLSTRTAIAGGYRFSVRRYTGWTGTPTFAVYAIDTEGNENS